MLTFSHLALFALASALGSLARYGLSSLVGMLVKTSFPWGIFLTNVTGCFLFGTVWGMACTWRLLSDATRVILLTGFMGSFTTFSTFIFDANAMLVNKAWLALACNIAGQIVLGILALQLGMRFSACIARLAG